MNNMESILNKGRDMLKGFTTSSVETEQAGAGTLATLDHQGEQMSNAEVGMDKISGDMGTLEKALSGLEQSPLSFLVSPFRGKGKNAAPLEGDPQGGAGAGAAGTCQISISEDGGIGQPSQQQQIGIEVNGEMGKNVNVDDMGVVMGQVAEGHNPRLERMNEQADNIIGKIKGVNQRIGKLLSK